MSESTPFHCFDTGRLSGIGVINPQSESTFVNIPTRG